MVAIMMTALLGLAAIVTDTAMIWLSRRGLQNAVDAAALAGAQELPDDLAGAEGIACTYATEKNYVQDMAGEGGDCDGLADVIFSTTYVANDSITVTATRSYDLFFGRLFDWEVTEIEIDASATAVLGSIASACPFPIFQTWELLPAPAIGEELEYYELTAMHLAGSDNEKGNFLTVDVGSGANAVLDAMVNNACEEQIGPEASTEPGGKIGKVLDGFQWRIYCAGGGGTKPNNTPDCPSYPQNCPDPDVSTYLESNGSGGGQLVDGIDRDTCTRLVVIPVFPNTIYDYTGKETVTIEGYAVFYIAGVCDQSSCTHDDLGELKKGDAWGYYVRLEATTLYWDSYNKLGTKVVTLID
jgi:hypothetical protein